MSSTRHSDMGAAMAGLVVGGCLIYVFVFGMVKWTDAKYKGKHAAAAVEATK